MRLLDRFEMQNDLVESVDKTEHHRHLVPKLAACHRSFRHWRCENNHDWAEPENSCSLRICPHCSRKRSLILAGRLENFLGDRIIGLRYVVLAERNSRNLAEGIASLWASWTRLRRWVRWKRKVTGCMVVMEVTRNRKDGTWHPHLNLLIEGEYFPFGELNQAWLKATRGKGKTSFIRAADAGTIRELIKYVTKLSDLLDDPAAIDEFLTAITRQRLVRTYGSFFGLNVDDEEKPEQGCCPDCGPDKHVSVVNLGPVAAWQLSLEFDGVMRITRRDARATSDRLHDALQFPACVPPASRTKRFHSLVRLWDHMHEKFAATSRTEARQ